MKKPDPKDYPDRVNAFVRAMRLWQSTQCPSFPSMPPDLENLFTPMSVQEAKLNQVVDEVQKRNESER